MMEVSSARIGQVGKTPESEESATICAGVCTSAGQSQVSNFYINRSVLITGGSGFIGKVLIEKLLRSCPGIRRIFVLIRPKWNKTPGERLKELLRQPLFDKLRAAGLEPEDRVVAVEGDVVNQNLGLSDQNLLRIMNEVSVIYHSAATVKFDEPLKQSVAINMTGTKNMVELCRKIPQLAALVHVSTAYANCDLDKIDEHVYPVPLDPDRLIEMADWLDQDTLQELKVKLLAGKPNTYTYTKALAEWLLIKSARDLPVVICRPSIVAASWREPVAGWIDNVNGPTGVILGTGKGLVRSMFANPSCVADLVPVDTVINLIITLGWFANAYQGQKSVGETVDCFSDSIIGSGGSCSTSGDESLENYNDGNHSIDYRYSNERLGDHDFTTSDAKLQQSNANSNSKINQENFNNNNNNHSESLDNRDTNNQYKQADEFIEQTSLSSHKLTFQANTEDRVLNYVAQRQMAEQNRAAFEYKLKQFRHNVQTTLTGKGLGEELADIPVFHCTSGAQNPITWGKIAFLITTILAIYPSSQVYRYPNGRFTYSKLLDDFYRITLHYIPAYIVDAITRILGGKPILVRIFKKFDSAANVLKAFTTKEWHFDPKNHITLAEELMNEDDRRRFNFDLKSLNWEQFLTAYVIGVRQYMLKEPISDLEEARSKLRIVYYRNLSLQVLFLAIAVYCIYVPLFKA